MTTSTKAAQASSCPIHAMSRKKGGPFLPAWKYSMAWEVASHKNTVRGISLLVFLPLLALLMTSYNRRDTSNGLKVEQVVATSSCQGRYIYVYDLPPSFNKDLLDACKTLNPWGTDLCPTLSNHGMGKLHSISENAPSVISEHMTPGAWYESDMFTMDVYYHKRMMEYECVTSDPAQASVFFIPFYVGLAITSSLFGKDLEELDRPAKEAINWLDGQPWWHRHQGRDHMLISSRNVDTIARQPNTTWGTAMITMSYMLNVSILSIEAMTYWLANTHSVPYLTSLHPRTDQDLESWQTFLRGHKRDNLAVYIGAAHGEGSSVRHHLTKACAEAKEDCKQVTCKPAAVCRNTSLILGHYLSSHFCLQPPGDSPARKGLFDCMIAGGIPVLSHPLSATVYAWHLPEAQDSFSVFFNQTEVANDYTIVMKRLASISPEQRERLRMNIINNIIPRIVYYAPGATNKAVDDAFDVSITAVLQKVAMLNLTRQATTTTR